MTEKPSFNELNETAKKSEKWFCFAMLAVLVVIIVSGVIQYYGGYGNAIDWILASNTSPYPILFDEFNIGLFKFQIPADNYLVWQTFTPSDIHINYQYYFAYLIALTFGISAYQATITKLGRYPFIFANLIFILLYTQIHLEETILFGERGRTYIFILIGVHLALGYLFNSFVKNVHVAIRMALFLAVHGLTAFVIHEYAGVKDPFMVIMPYSMTPGIVLSVIFILFTAQEVIFGILFLTTRSTIGGQGNGKHFLILGGIYLVNLILLTARNIGVIRTEIAIVDEYWILILSALVAVWSIPYKQILFPKYPLKNDGKLLVISLGIICFAFFALQSSTINTPAIDALKDVISFIHIGFGSMFFFYVILNFISALYQNIAVYKIVYKEVNFPFVTSLLAGLAVVAGLYFYTDKSAFLESKGGYYNVHGDVQSYLGEFGLAEKYYSAAGFYGGHNLKAYHNIAAYAHYEDDAIKEEDYLLKSTYRDQTDITIVALADFYKEKGNFLKAYLTLQEGLEKYPKSTYIRNNLAMQFAQTNILDSALFYFDPTYYGSEWEHVSKTNSWYIYAKSNLLFNKDSVNELLNNADATLASNLIAYSNLKNQFLDTREISIPADSSLNSITFPLINNMALNRGVSNEDSLKSTFQKAALHYTNDNLKHYLYYDLALMAYKNHDYNGFFRYMDAAQAGSNPVDKGKYFNTVGLISLKLNAPRLAANYFGSALQYKFEEAKINYGIALSEANLVTDAIDYWNQVLNTDLDSSHQQVAFNQLNILKLTTDEAINNSNDAVTYQYLRAYRNLFPYDTFIAALHSISNESMKADLLIVKMKDQLKSGRLDHLDNLYNILNRLNITPGQLSVAKSDLDVAMALIYNDLNKIGEIKKNPTDELLKEWPFLNFPANSTDSLSLYNLYNEMGINNPFNIPSVMMAVSYFKEANNGQAAYDILINAIEVNPYSVPLLKAYALTTIEENIAEFGEDVLPRIAAIVSPNEYDQFAKQFYELKEASESASIWDDEE